jgi:hypothetical protein
MILAHSVLGGDVAEHVILLLIVSSHAPLDALCAVPLQDFRFFSILLGIFSPSRRQMRCTRSFPTCQPAVRNSAVILR